jgi:alanine racemase
MTGRPAWAEVSLATLRENFRAIRRHVGPGVEVVGVLKANAYGHGAEAVARALAAEGAAWFGVTSAAEALPLRRAGLSQPVLLFSGFWPGEEELLADHGLVPFLFDAGQLQRLEDYGRRHDKSLPFHLKIDTGMGRLGLDPADLPAFLEALGRCRHARLEGLCTHFASADEAGGEQTRRQIERFGGARRQVEQQGFHPRWLHMANSAGLARFPESHGTMVRPGIALYGYQSCASPPAVKPVLALKSRVMSVRAMPAGAPLGYGATYVTAAAARIAAVPAGYADGIPRLLSSRGRALVRGCAVPIVGRVSMDLTLLDVTAVPGVQPGDPVVFVGRQGEAEITADEPARLAGTVPYEILCGIGVRLPRVYVES